MVNTNALPKKTLAQPKKVSQPALSANQSVSKNPRERQGIIKLTNLTVDLCRRKLSNKPMIKTLL